MKHFLTLNFILYSSLLLAQNSAKEAGGNNLPVHINNPHTVSACSYQQVGNNFENAWTSSYVGTTINTTDPVAFPVIKLNFLDGSGGDYLSNEIFYRVAQRREKIGSAVKTGHYHIANLSSSGLSPTATINNVKDIVEASLSAL